MTVEDLRKEISVDTGMELPIETGENAPSTTVEESRKKLYEIWYEYELSARTSEEAGKRQRVLREFNAALTPEAVEFFVQPSGVRRIIGMGRNRNEMVLTHGQLIQDDAIKAAREELIRKKVAMESEKRKNEPKPPTSAGGKRHARRVKAAERGVNPGDIH